MLLDSLLPTPHCPLPSLSELGSVEWKITTSSGSVSANEEKKCCFGRSDRALLSLH